MKGFCKKCGWCAEVNSAYESIKRHDFERPECVNKGVLLFCYGCYDYTLSVKGLCVVCGEDKKTTEQ